MPVTKLAGVPGWARYSAMTSLYKRNEDDDPDDGMEVGSVRCHRRLFMIWQRDYKWEMRMDICAPLIPSGSITRRYKTNAEMMRDLDKVLEIWPKALQ